MADGDFFRVSDSDPFDLKRLAGASFLARVEYHPELSSTQDRAHEIAAQGAATELPVLVVADVQKAGRGRGANRWWTGDGSLAASLLFDPAAWGLARRASPERSLAAAVAVIDAVAPALAGHAVGLHWPNDVFADGCKLAGILIDALPDGRHILGIGLNLNSSLAHAPPEVRTRATSIFDLTGCRQDRTTILLAVLERLEARFRQLADSPEELGREFHELCLQVGSRLTIHSGSRRETGTCAGVAIDGALLLDTAAGRQRFYSGVLG
jgi:BirA family biotin operon repressor/biotin-[acetyl-CoA-carboxylase] ligase